MESSELVDYYRRRAAEYEAIFAKPERQDDLKSLERALLGSFVGKNILEIACGTGWWTERIARVASRIVATDLAEEPMRIAQAKAYPPGKVGFRLADAYALLPDLGTFDAAFAGFWWSHIPRPHIDEFLASLHARLEPGARVIFLDNRFVAGSSTPVSDLDADGNTYQLRTLGDGSNVRVLKNFPSEADLRERLEPHASQLAVEWLEYYWLVDYHVK